jgi:hypothetical protein
VEVKAFPGREAERQLIRLRQATDLINLRRRTDSSISFGPTASNAT